MPVESLHYAIARVKAREGTLLSAERLERIMDASDAAEALRLLKDAGYGGAQSDDYESMTSYELRQSAAFIQSITPLPAVTDLFLMKADFHNLKAAFKLRETGSEELAALSETGLLSGKETVDAVAQQNYDALPAPLREAALGAEEVIAAKFDPRALDLYIDACWLKQAATASAGQDAFVRDYFTTRVDFFNGSLLLRSTVLGEGPEWIRPNLLEGGKVPVDVWMEIAVAGAAREKLLPLADRTFAERFEDAQNTGKCWEFEKYGNEIISGKLKDASGELFTIRPLIAYLLNKEAEARAVRMIMAAKQNGVAMETVKERLRGIYG